MKCKKNYKDMKKLEAYIKRTKDNYRKNTGSGKYKKRKWTKEEIQIILDHNKTDRELSEELERSVTAIQVKRAKINKGYYDKGGEYEEE